MAQGFPWHALATALLLGFLWAGAFLYLFSFRRYETYRTAARLLLLVVGLLGLWALGTGLSRPEAPALLLYRQHQALGIATVVLVLLTAFFALVEPLASWLPFFTVPLLLFSLLAASAAWTWGQRLRHAPPTTETLEIPQEEVVPDTGEFWMEEPMPETPEP